MTRHVTNQGAVPILIAGLMSAALAASTAGAEDPIGPPTAAQPHLETRAGLFHPRASFFQSMFHRFFSFSCSSCELLS